MNGLAESKFWPLEKPLLPDGSTSTSAGAAVRASVYLHTSHGS